VQNQTAAGCCVCATNYLMTLFERDARLFNSSSSTHKRRLTTERDRLISVLVSLWLSGSTGVLDSDVRAVI
jgi:hypothetical protein